MTYKAIMNKNRYTICHAGPLIIDASGRAHVPAGSPGGGQFTFKPDAYTVRNVNTPYEGYDGSGPRASGSSTTRSGPKYTREDPDTLTTEQLVERNRWYNQYSNYKKNFGSTEQDIDQAIKNASSLVDKGQAFINKIPEKDNRTKLDLSRMSNQELNDYINRARLEQQYNDYYNPPKQNDTKEWISLAIAGAGLLVNAAGVAIPFILKAAESKKKGG